jgi:hypothetical protein
VVFLFGKKQPQYTDFSNVVTGQNYVIPEDLPEGPYGSPVNRELGKSTAWNENQRHYSAFNYENKTLHEDAARQYPGAHLPHDDPDEHTEPPYEDSQG